MLAVVFVVLKGVAFRFKMLANGRRQIFGYLLPGDMCDPEFVISNYCDHTVCVLSDAEVAVVDISELKSCMARMPHIGRALMLAHERDGSRLRESLLNLGQRDAVDRIAYFLVKISDQLYPGEHPEGGSLPMPLTQHELADSVGLTVVHVNRCLQQLRDDEVIAWGRKRVTILDRARLIQISSFGRPCGSIQQS
jgi:CRP-like cAMP-binding protein